MTRRPAIESAEGSVATRAGAGPAFDRHARRVSGNRSTRGLPFPLAAVAPDPALGRPKDRPAAVADEHVVLRLALWLADVAAEAALEAMAPAASSKEQCEDPRPTGRAGKPPTGESAL